MCKQHVHLLRSMAGTVTALSLVRHTWTHADSTNAWSPSSSMTCYCFSTSPTALMPASTSFTLQYLGALKCEYIVLRNDEKTVEEIRAMNPRGVVVSPGPGEQRLQWAW